VVDWLQLADKAIVATRECLGEPVVYEGVEIRAEFDANFEAVDFIGEAESSSVSPVLGVRLVDLPSPPKAGDTFTVRGAWYEVVDVRFDGSGAAHLFSVETAAPGPAETV